MISIARGCRRSAQFSSIVAGEQRGRDTCRATILCTSWSLRVSMDQTTLVERLTHIVGPDGVFHRPSDLIVYEYDGSVDGAVETARPVAVTLPTTTEQVAAIV